MDQRTFFNQRVAQWVADIGEEKASIIKSVVDAMTLTGGESVLDVGCGTGVLYPFIMTKGVSTYIGTDIAEEMLRAFSEKHGDVSLVQANFDQPCTFQQKFDCIVLFNSIPHFENIDCVLENAKRHLAPNGRFIIAHGRTRTGLRAHHEKIGFSLGREAIPSNAVLKAACEKAGLHVVSSSDDQYFQWICERGE